jgi:predicted nuclease with TOPRIM domain
MEIQKRRSDDTTIQVVADRLSSLHNDVSDIRGTLKESMKEMTTAFNKLIQLEEKQIYIAQDIQRIGRVAERGHERLDKALVDDQIRYEKLETRLDSLEKDSPLQKQTSAWVLSAVYAAAGMLLMYVAKAVGLL